MDIGKRMETGMAFLIIRNRRFILKSTIYMLFLIAGLSYAADYFPLSIGRYWTYYGEEYYDNIFGHHIKLIKYTLSVVSRNQVQDTTRDNMRIEYSLKNLDTNAYIFDFDLIKQLDGAGFFDSIVTASTTYREVGDTVILDQSWVWGVFTNAGNPLIKIPHSMYSGDTLFNQKACLYGLMNYSLASSGKTMNNISGDSVSTLIANSSDQRPTCALGEGIGLLWYRIRCGGSDVMEKGESLAGYGFAPAHIQGPLFPIRSALPSATQLPSAVFNLLGRPMDFSASKKQVNSIVIARDKDGSGCRVLFPELEAKAAAAR
jgi:hypothetical protein